MRCNNISYPIGFEIDILDFCINGADEKEIKLVLNDVCISPQAKRTKSKRTFNILVSPFLDH